MNVNAPKNMNNMTNDDHNNSQWNIHRTQQKKSLIFL